MTHAYPTDLTYRWQRPALRRRDERRPLEIQAEVVSECSRASLRTLLNVLWGTDTIRRLGASPVPHGRV
ncbi:MAG: hypothetical protein ACRDWT_02715 [Jatrophihabitantaceae bacterium]